MSTVQWVICIYVVGIVIFALVLGAIIRKMNGDDDDDHKRDRDT